MTTQTKTKPPQNVYQKIATVQAELAKIGISKSRKNQTPGAQYNFRGIDEVYNTLAPLMADNGLCILPRIVEHTMSDRGKTRNGNAIYSAIVTAEFDFVSADDGTIHVVRTMGEAMDSSDKATNKAMSAAYKYAALMTFAIPTEGDNDADAHTHEVIPTAPAEKVAPPPVNDAQLDELQILFDQLDVPVADFLAVAKVPNLKALPAPWFDRAKKWVNDKAAEKRAKQDDTLADDAAFLAGDVA
jgi:hypothetical protein